MSIALLARTCRTVALGLWLGGVVMAFVAAPIIFEQLAPDRRKAGEVNGAILAAAEKVKCVLAVVALVCDALLFFGAGAPPAEGWRRWLPVSFLLGAIACGLFAAFWLEPRILALRDKVDFTTQSPERVEFGKLHGMSMGLLLLEAVLVGVSLVLGMV